MIKINGEPIQIGQFPDGTMLTKIEVPKTEITHMEWFFEEEKETVALWYLVSHLRANGCEKIELYMPYIPNARQDRVKEEKDIFTLKYFANLINSLNFHRVTVLDPHSSVSEALFDRICVQRPKHLIETVIKKIEEEEGSKPFLFYPDEGAGKRYSSMIKLPYVFGIKKRDWETGQIQGLDISGDVQSIVQRDVLIVDDICSKGGTFIFSAKKLKELGVKHIYLYITHCENTILEGEVLTEGLFQRVYTTNSIFTKEHSKIEVITL